ncbi:MAG: universal stress protein [Actinomycetota bacterium]|nr:universal stress protein [Actinomycetota bacterium]
MTAATGTADRVVVGVDGSDASLAALRWASFVAEATDSSLDVVAVWQPTTAFGLMGEGWGALPTDWDPDAVTREALEQAMASVFGDDVPLTCESRVIEGNIAQVLLETSADARMLVVGSRGHGGFASLLLGSVSAACAEHATCPVLVIHGTTPPPPLTKAVS